MTRNIFRAVILFILAMIALHENAIYRQNIEAARRDSLLIKTASLEEIRRAETILELLEKLREKEQWSAKQSKPSPSSGH